MLRGCRGGRAWDVVGRRYGHILSQSLSDSMLPSQRGLCKPEGAGGKRKSREEERKEGKGPLQRCLVEKG